LRIAAVVKVVSIVVVDVNVIGVIPVVCPVLRVWIHQQERIPAILETRIALINNRSRAEAEEVLASEIEIEAGLRNVITAVASTLRPGAMIGGPVLGPILLPGIVPLPAAALL
jgi:hypothetical protein